MSLIYRIKRLIRADAHALVENLEEPKWVLAQAIRDMETSLEKHKNEIGNKKQDYENVVKNIETLSLKVKDLEQDIDLAINEKREDIAKTLIRKSLSAKKSLELLAVEKERLSKELNHLEKDLSEKQSAYDDVCAKAGAMSFDKKKDVVFDEAISLVAKNEALEHEVELELLRRLKAK